MTPSLRTRCPQCGRGTPRDAVECPACAAVLAALCPDCGTTHSVFDRACPSCGMEREPARRTGSGRWIRVALLVLLLAAATVAVLVAFPRSVESRRTEAYDAALAEFQAGRYDAARLAFLRYLSEHGEFGPARFMLGLSLARVGREAEAEREIRRALAGDPNLDPAALWLARRAFAERRFDEVLRLADQALADGSRPPEAWLLRGKVLARSGHRDVGAALRALEQAVHAGEDDPEALVLLGELTLVVDRAWPEPVRRTAAREYLERARDRIRGILDAGQAPPAAWLFLARTEASLGNVDAAWECRSRAGEAGEPAERDLLTAELLFARGDAAGATRILDGPLVTASGPSVALRAEALLREEGPPHLADAVLARAIHAWPGEPSLLLRAGRRRLEAGDPAGAEAKFREASAAAPDDALAEVWRAEAVLALGDRAAAEEVLRVAAGRPGAPASAGLRLADLLLDTPEDDPSAASRRAEAGRLLAEAAAAPDGEEPSGIYRDFLVAKRLLRERRHGEALEALRSVVDRDPADPAPRLLLARTLARVGRHEAGAIEMGAVLRLSGETPARRLERAEMWLAAGRRFLARAREDGEAALALDPAGGASRLLLARVAAAAGQVREAEDAFREALGDPETAARARIGLGRLALARGSLDEAEAEIVRGRDAARDAMERLEAVAALGEVADARQAGRLTPGARRLWEEMAAALPDLAAPAVRFAEGLLDAGDLRAAARWAEEALARDPRGLRARRVLFETCFAAGDGGLDRPRAEAVLAEMAARAPDDPDTRYAEGKLALFDGQASRALKALARARDAAPGDARIAYYLGAARLRAGDLPGARDALAEALRIEPRMLSARRLFVQVGARIGRSLWEGGAAAAAAETLRGVLQRDPGHLPSLAMLASLWFEAGRKGDPAALEAARADCEELVDRLRREGRPAEQADALVLLMDVVFVQDDRPALVRAAELYLELRPGEPDGWLRKALALDRAGRTAEAESTLRTARERIPGDRGLLAALGSLLARDGRPGEAADLLGTWLADHPDDLAVRAERGSLLFRAGRPEGGAELLDALRRDPDLWRAAEDLTTRWVGERRTDEAVPALRTLLSRTSRKAEFRGLLGEVLLSRDPGSGEARELLREAVREGPGRNRLFGRASVTALRAFVPDGPGKDLREVADAFADWARELPAPEPGSPSAALLAEGWLLAGVSAHREGETERAEYRYRKALEADPASHHALNDLSELLAETGRDAVRLSEAVSLARRAVEARPGDPDLLDSLGFALLRSGDPAAAAAVLAAAEAAYRQAGADPGRLARSLLRQARARLAAGDRDRARELLAAAAAADPALAAGADHARLDREAAGDRD